jgi:hypothetical protein
MYDMELKVYIPSLDEIKKNTGVDLVLEEGNKERAEGKVRNLVSKAKDFLYSGKPYESQNVFSYLIKFNKEYQTAFKLYAIKYIESTWVYGTEETWDKVPKQILNAINGSVLHIQFFSGNILSEVRNSSEVW